MVFDSKEYYKENKEKMTNQIIIAKKKRQIKKREEKVIKHENIRNEILNDIKSIKHKEILSKYYLKKYNINLEDI